MPDKPEPIFETTITANHLEAVARSILQIARHIREDSEGRNMFFSEWDDGKNWYFDSSDIQKNLGLSYEFLKSFMQQYLDATENEENNLDTHEFIVHDKMFEYVKKKTKKNSRATKH